MLSPCEYLDKSVELFLERLQKANPDLSQEDILLLASGQIRSVSPFGKDYREVADLLIATAREKLLGTD
jgi:hypothetical protein